MPYWLGIDFETYASDILALGRKLINFILGHLPETIKILSPYI